MAASTLTASKPWIEFAPSLRPKDANEEWLHRRQRLSNQGVVTWPPPPPVWRLQPVERQSFDCVALYCSFWINSLICFVFCDPRQEAFLGFIGFCTSVKHATVRFLLVWGSAHLWGLIDLKWVATCRWKKDPRVEPVPVDHQMKCGTWSSHEWNGFPRSHPWNCMKLIEIVSSSFLLRVFVYSCLSGSNVEIRPSGVAAVWFGSRYHWYTHICIYTCSIVHDMFWFKYVDENMNAYARRMHL